MTKQIDASTLALASRIKTDLTVGANGTVTAPDDLWSKHLPEGLSAEAVGQVQSYRQQLVAATLSALGEVGAEAVQKDKELPSVEVSYNFGPKNDHANEVVTQRVRTTMTVSKNPTKPEEGKTNIHGCASTEITVRAAKGKGVTGQVKAAIRSRYTEIFS